MRIMLRNPSYRMAMLSPYGRGVSQFRRYNPIVMPHYPPINFRQGLYPHQASQNRRAVWRSNLIRRTQRMRNPSCQPGSCSPQQLKSCINVPLPDPYGKMEWYCCCGNGGSVPKGGFPTGYTGAACPHGVDWCIRPTPGQVTTRVPLRGRVSVPKQQIVSRRARRRTLRRNAAMKSG